ncbi:ribosome-associated translation inhibitor RaiA [Cellulophaga baltica]|uniref:ribosome hibernation-promoting factor, HPF/YfiA family n=1 Tax=Cellulophaga TaxID=104264 RepID=UPI001C070AE7|nr:MULTISPECIES: ribosome-associated translation inhibitor RaiA [Cellulophaga]MBU2994939.1 ribosome-associated translation inhibitor RaiA [Cellulophaga baltica]MDO6766333.1 ribosome-associated translation inhibitor RaiA [Cellulophaga sp. 1_MG-2023]
MKVNTQSVNFNADGNLIVFVNERLNKLDQYYNKVIGSDVYLKVEKTKGKENKIAEIKVYVPKNEFIVSKQCKSFEEAIDLGCGAMKRQLLKQKEKN